MTNDDHSAQPSERAAEQHHDHDARQREPRRLTPAPTHAYRATSGHHCRPRPLKPKQELVLAALAHRCPTPGREVSARDIAADLGLRLGSLMLSLRYLATLKLVVEHPSEQESDEPMFSPTSFGLARVRTRRGV